MAKIEGLNKLTASLEKFKDNAIDDITEILAQGGKKIEERAVKYAPNDRGLLRGTIIAEQESEFKTQIVASAAYAPFIEFGTKKRFKPQGRGDIAAQFRGEKPSGTFDEFVTEIARWLKVRGLYPSNIRGAKAKLNYAKFFAIRLAKTGIMPQPFFFRAYDETLPGILRLLRKYKK